MIVDKLGFYKRRDGVLVKVICILNNKESLYPVISIHNVNTDEEFILRYSVNGKIVTIGEEKESSYDLVEYIEE